MWYINRSIQFVIDTLAGPLLEYFIDLPADSLQVSVPPEFLKPGTEYKLEILAIDVTGNQTIVESDFETIE